MKVEDAVKRLTTEFLTDPGFRERWLCHIAMQFKDRAYQYKKQTGKNYLTQTDIHIIATEAANNFINTLTKNE
jgi:hypothetical protein